MPEEIEKSEDCDDTIDEILRSVVFQNKHGNKLKSYDIQTDKVILTFG